ncbi:Kinase suppressor of Ras 2-like [Oopsacas minuta]|uniref:Kinase suppressor of Ras 2-like n=1 Tax=Oopsacas minuta TaxID=111878 RepID=A0AAV7JVY1_9METZ|nr:Kinase suppressor of Ras 2-like [Oopsacas minuta]
MNGHSSNPSPDYNTRDDPHPTRHLSDKAPPSEHYRQKQEYLPVYKPNESPNGLSANQQGEGGVQPFNFNEYKVYYHSIYLGRKQLKEARRDYSDNPTSSFRLSVHTQEQFIVMLFVKLLQMRRSLLREKHNLSQEDLKFCMGNPTVEHWLKAVVIQSRRLIECIKSQFDSIESLLDSNKDYLLELLAPHPIHEIERELFLSSWSILQSFSSSEFHDSLSNYHFSWTECCDRMLSQEIPSRLYLSDPISESTVSDPRIRAPSPDPWTPPRSPDRVIGPNNHTFPRPHKPSLNPDSVGTDPQKLDGHDTIPGDGTPTPRTFIGIRFLRRIFRPRNISIRSYVHQQCRGSMNSLIMEYEQEPRAPRYKNHIQASPDNDFGSQLRLQTQIQDEVFDDDAIHSPSCPSDTAQTDGSSSPRVSSSPQPTDWEINFEEIRNIKEIKSCKFSSLATGNWHGQVMIKTYKGSLCFVRDQFQQELNALRNIRHDNVILFRGACTTSDPNLTIVTSVKHSPTLHHVIRISPKHPLERVLTILKEISQAMTYLHDRKIVHQNLTTDSIYLERGNAKPILFDIAVNPLLDNAGIDPGSWEFPRGYVSCMAPEIIDSLSPSTHELDRYLPFSDKSDVFAFGSIWYELYTGQYPLQGDPIEVVLFKVSNGYRQTLDLIIGSRSIKEELCRCWNKDPLKRPSFQSLGIIIDKLPNLQQPRKMPARSSSQSAVMPLKSSEATM